MTLPEFTALLIMAWPMSWLCVGLAASASASGRLRSLALMPVATKYGHRTLALTWSVTSDRSWYSVSDRLTTACLLTL